MIGFFFSPIDTVAYAQAHGRRTLRFIGVSAPVAQDIMMVVNSTFTSTMSSGFFIKKGAQLVGQIVLQSKS
ncbi:MAG: hypothetical protein B7Y25_03180 [Alphaproteobacteria bacterium 16-39-46]|nr:MAG: hypothetical protein B7Y25_03180 [Alphaproteobacteria bacterium 16-39-46]OZA43800.1 MAG: hypothetical protein B7X84_02115 [Alphaproteobacteria bacterium 17-39-52]